MLNSIEINTLLYQDFSTSQSDLTTSTNQEFSDLITALASTYILLTKSSFISNERRYFLNQTKDTLILIEIQKEKKRLITFDKSSGVFFINKRRAQKQELQQIIHKLSVYKSTVSEHSSCYLSNTTDPSSTSIPTPILDDLTNLSRHLNIQISITKEVKFNAHMKSSFANTLHSIIKQFKSKQDSINLQQQINFLIQFIKNLSASLSDNKVYIISNQSKRQGLKTYTLYIEHEKAVYIEKSGSVTNEFCIYLDTVKILFNNVPINQSSLNILRERFQAINHHLSINVAKIFEATKKTLS